jgi:hypothetical protein
MKTVRISEQELYDICHRIVGGENFIRSQFEPPIRLKTEVSNHFKLLSQMERPKNRFSNKAAHRLIIFALVSFLALTLKMGCEGYFQR